MDKVIAEKYGGDDIYSWAVKVNGKYVYTGMSRREAQRTRDQIKKKLLDKQSAK